MDDQHTATGKLPWSIDADGDIQDAEGNKIVDTQITGSDHIAFIVKACNERKELLNLLRWALDKLDLANDIIDPYEDGEPYAGVLVDQITIAIEQAKE